MPKKRHKSRRPSRPTAVILLPGRPRRISQAKVDWMQQLRRLGETDQEIADRLHISVRSVTRYLSGVKPEVGRRTEVDLRTLKQWCAERLWLLAIVRLRCTHGLLSTVLDQLDVVLSQMNARLVDLYKGNLSRAVPFLVQFVRSSRLAPLVEQHNRDVVVARRWSTVRARNQEVGITLYDQGARRLDWLVKTGYARRDQVDLERLFRA